MEENAILKNDFLKEKQEEKEKEEQLNIKNQETSDEEILETLIEEYKNKNIKIEKIQMQLNDNLEEMRIERPKIQKDLLPCLEFVDKTLSQTLLKFNDKSFDLTDKLAKIAGITNYSLISNLLYRKTRWIATQWKKNIETLDKYIKEYTNTLNIIIPEINAIFDSKKITSQFTLVADYLKIHYLFTIIFEYLNFYNLCIDDSAEFQTFVQELQSKGYSFKNDFKLPTDKSINPIFKNYELNVTKLARIDLKICYLVNSYYKQIEQLFQISMKNIILLLDSAKEKIHFINNDIERLYHDLIDIFYYLFNEIQIYKYPGCYDRFKEEYSSDLYKDLFNSKLIYPHVDVLFTTGKGIVLSVLPNESNKEYFNKQEEAIFAFTKNFECRRKTDNEYFSTHIDEFNHLSVFANALDDYKKALHSLEIEMFRQPKKLRIKKEKNNYLTIKIKYLNY